MKPLLNDLHVLVIEDDLLLREIIKVVLNSWHITVTTVGSYNDALVTLEQVQPQIILSDIELQDGNGYVLLRQWRIREAELGLAPIPAIAISGLTREEVQAVPSPDLPDFQIYLTKPFRITQLLDALTALLTTEQAGLERNLLEEKLLS